MKLKDKIAKNPTTVAIIAVSIICLIVGSLAVNFWLSLAIVGILNLIYFKDPIYKFFYSKWKKMAKPKLMTSTSKNENAPIYEYKVGDQIVSTGNDNMKKVLPKKEKIKKDKIKNEKVKKEKVKKEKKKKKIGWKIFECFLIFCCFCFIVGVIGVIYFFSYIVKHAPEFNPEKLYSTEPSVMYYSDLTPMATIGTKNRQIITYDELPEVFINALVATEDSKFFQHNGVDLSRFLVASFKQLLGQTDAGGASTLTMQLSKNYIVEDLTATGIKGIIRKFTDMYISVFKIEPTYTKEEIIEFYVNSGQLGSRYGVEAASQLYFNKSAKDMNISEAALLAGMFQAPSAYDPFYHPDKAEARRQTVLYLMHRHKYITDQEYDIALKLTVDRIVVNPEDSDIGADEIEDTARSAVDTVVAEVKERTGLDPRLVSMKIYTTIDKNKQNHVGNIMTGNTYKWENDNVQAGIAVVDVKTGALVAVGGSRENNKDGVFNHATQIEYQIGSTAKPLYDYGPAIEYLNWSTGTVLADEKITYSDGTSIGNWDGKYNGFQTMRTQLKLSRNIPALKTFQELDKGKIYTFVTKLGLHPENPLHEAHSIGGYNGENPLSLAAAYAAFANGGYYTEPYSVSKIIFNDTGKTQYIQTTTNQVMSNSTAYMVTSMLIDTSTYAIGGIKGITYAGKTGTTNFDAATKKEWKLPSGATKDHWVAGYNDKYAIALWYGYDSVKYGYNKVSSKKHTQLFQEVAKGVFQGKANFPMPSTVKKVRIEKDSATLMLPSEYTPENYTIEELFVAGTEPTTVSTRFSKLSSVSNLSASVLDNKVSLSWDAISTPDAFNADYLKELNKSAYRRDDELSKYVDSLIQNNQKILGTVGYNVYVQTDEGLVLLGWTSDTSYVISELQGEVTLVVKSCYSNFKDNMSDGKSVKVSIKSIPTTKPDPEPNPDEGI